MRWHRNLYARNIVEEPLKIDQKNYYILFFCSEIHFHHHCFAIKNLNRIPTKSNILQDMVHIQLATNREEGDVILPVHV
jgi:hypothetical protein